MALRHIADHASAGVVFLQIVEIRTLSDQFFTAPILNNPYEYPAQHWELTGDGQPTQNVIGARRKADFITPIPTSKRRSDAKTKDAFEEESDFNPIAIINQVRGEVDAWRKLPNEREWNVTPTTARLLNHWRLHDFAGIRPCVHRWGCKRQR